MKLCLLELALGTALALASFGSGPDEVRYAPEKGLTHVPSSLLLLTVAFAPSFPVAAALFLLREGLVEMEVPTRQSYVLAVVEPHERTLASATTNLVRLSGWALAPLIAGGLMEEVGLVVPLVVGAAMKIAYDVLLYFSFRELRPPEERPTVP